MSFMRSWAVITKKTLYTFLGILTLFLVIGYVTAEYALQKKYKLTLSPLPISTDSTTINHGKRVTRVLGCVQCHGNNFEGKLVHSGDEDIFTGDIYSTNLSTVMDNYSSTDLEKAIRFGTKNDSTAIWIGMPSRYYYHLSDSDTKAIVSYLKNIQPVNNPGIPENNMTVQFAGKIMGGWLYILSRGDGPLGSASTDTSRPRLATSAKDNIIDKGKYLTTLTCSQCHGSNFRGDDGYWNSPDLSVASVYTFEQFQKLMKTGKALGGRDLGYMSEVAQNQFSHFTEKELKSIYRFLQDRKENQ